MLNSMEFDDRGHATGCFWYTDEKDVEASIPYCEYFHEVGSCPCSESCPHYISREDVNNLVRKHVDCTGSNSGEKEEVGNISTELKEADVSSDASVTATERQLGIDKDCSKCIFGIYYHFDKGGMPTIRCCHGYEGDTETDAHRRILADGPCDRYPVGHALYLERKKVTPHNHTLVEGIPANLMYMYDALDYHKDPVGLCDSFSKETCDRGDGKFCYYRNSEGLLGCSACMDIHNTHKLAEPDRSLLIESFRMAGVSEEKIKEWEREN